ncbi:retron-type reverse transcriptase [Paenibacillus motobuensis]|uniref:Phage head morphogenesis domain-containing protein n=1 Tax=Paenibacillus motobuensis TaxID=295324 RepID=A0ABN0YCG0_9BACL
MAGLPSAQQILEQLKLIAGPYAKFALASRKKYVDLRLRQDQAVRSIYIRAADKVAKEIRRLKRLGTGSEMNMRYMVALQDSLRQTGIGESLTELLQKDIVKAVDAGSTYSMEVTMSQISKTKLAKQPVQRSFFRANKQAVEACWARTERGLHLSDRIWQKDEKYRKAMTEIIQDGVATGEDPVETARQLEKYVRRGKKTLAVDYPEMMERMGNRIPQDISYEALRLVRTETAAAFGEGTIAAASVSPSYKGMKWVLSGSHPVPDICDELANADHGLGKGVWPPGQEPPMPAHPNCLCVLISVHEDTDDFMQRLNEWTKNPQSHPDLEDWYTNVYSEVA